MVGGLDVVLGGCWGVGLGGWVVGYRVLGISKHCKFFFLNVCMCLSFF